MTELLISPLILFTLAFSTLLFIFSIRKVKQGRILLFFVNFLVVTWLFSAVGLANNLALLPPFLSSYTSSILVFLLHYFLLFQYLFVARYLLVSEHTVSRFFFVLAYSLWAVYFSLPSNIGAVVEGDNQLLQASFAFVSLSPSLFFILLTLYKFFINRLFIPKKLFVILLSGLVLPIIIVYELIYIQLESSTLSLNLIFISLSVSVYFYSFLLYFDQRVRILTSFKEKLVLIISLLVLIPLTVRTTYVYNNSRNILIANAQKTTELENTFYADRLQFVFEQFKNNSVFLSKLPEFLQLSVEQKSIVEVEAIFSRYLDVNPEVDTIAFVDSNGKQRAVVKQGDGNHVAIPQTELGEITQDELETFKNITDVHIFRVTPKRNDKSEIERPFNPIVKIVVPVLFESKNIGFVVVDEEGYYILHPNLELVWGSPRELATGVSLATENPQLWQAVTLKRGNSRDKRYLDKHLKH